MVLNVEFGLVVAIRYIRPDIPPLAPSTGLPYKSEWPSDDTKVDNQNDVYISKFVT